MEFVELQSDNRKNIFDFQSVAEQHGVIWIPAKSMLE